MQPASDFSPSMDVRGCLWRECQGTILPGGLQNAVQGTETLQ